MNRIGGRRLLLAEGARWGNTEKPVMLSATATGTARFNLRLGRSPLVADGNGFASGGRGESGANGDSRRAAVSSKAAGEGDTLAIWRGCKDAVLR
jgi:hypothetical protein